MVNPNKNVIMAHPFTFQYVSINTVLSHLYFGLFLYLHSNMFLLIHVENGGHTMGAQFTFQYVSINTNSYLSLVCLQILFTFQYVSINTILCRMYGSDYGNLHSNMFLLIPVFHKGLSDKHYSTTFCRPCHFLFFQDP